MEDSFEDGIEKTEDYGEEEATSKVKYEIMNYPADTTLSGYVEMWDNGQLEVPPFQRDYVWDQVKASKLIESFLLGLPVPGVFLFKQRNSKSFLIVDGQQRITSVVYFIKGLFNEKKFRLKKVSEKWDGKSFDELSEEEQFTIKGSVLRSTIIQQINPIDNTSIYLIFERLNTGGVNLNPMEVRQCVSYGPFVDFLKELNKNTDWRSILGSKTPDKRMRDVELVLRCFAMANALDDYEKPMKGFLDGYMERCRGISAQAMSEMQEKFTKVCNSIVKELGEKPFHLRGRLNYGALDSVFRAIYLEGECLGLNKKFENIKANQEYMDAISYNTSDDVEVKMRMNLARKILID